MAKSGGPTNHNCVIGLDGWVYCWGRNESGQLGTGDTNSRSTPVAIQRGEIPADATIESLYIGGRHGCVITDAGDAYCWGENNSGQLGNGLSGGRGDSFDLGIDQSTPVAVQRGIIPTNVKFSQMALGGDASVNGSPPEHTCALDSAGQAYCWGYNYYGQLGTGNTTSSNIPVAVQSNDLGHALYGKTITQITAGYSHTCALDSAGQAYCWGNNYHGQLGTGVSGGVSYYYDDGIDFNVPVPIKANDPTDALHNKTITQVIAGRQHTCALDSDGKVYCWGYNNYGQLGTGNATDFNVPVPIKANDPTDALHNKTITQVIAGRQHTCALDSTGKAYCWGYNQYGQLGTGNSTSSNVPVSVKADQPTDVLYGKIITQITAGGYDTCALDSAGQAYCWGYNYYGRLGIGNNTSSNVPLLVKPGYLIYFGGTPTSLGLYPTGNNTKLTSIELKVISPAVSGPATVNITLHSTTTNTTYNTLNQVYTFISPPTPIITQVIPNAGSANGNTAIRATNLSNLKLADDFTQITAGGSHTCALDSDNKAYCWGGGYSGQLGTGNTNNSNVPVLVKADDPTDALYGKTIAQITAGSSHTCALDSTGQAYCWGHNQYGQLGTGDTTNSNVPVAVQSNDPTDALYGKTITQITASQHHTCATDSTGQAYCWGRNGFGQLGNGDTNDSNVPVLVEANNPTDALYGKTIAQITAGTSHTCALDSTGQAYCWGYNGSGQLGTGDTTNSNVPVAVQSNDPTDALYGKTITQITASQHHTCATDSTGQAYCWGRNGFGQLGNGDTNDSNVPVLVEANNPTDALYGKTITQITAGTSHTCALDSTGQAYCWGYNGSGQLGTGDTTNSNVPVAVQSNDPTDALYGKTITQITASQHHTCATDSTGQAYCWGRNGFGQLGNGDTNDSNVPVLVEANNPTDALYGKTITQITAGTSHTCALDSTGQAYCWGHNQYGQLGTGDTTNSNVPVAVQSNDLTDALYGKTIAQITAGSSHTCALDSAGQAYCWGYNYYGRLGTKQSGIDLSMQRYTPAYVMMKSDPLEVSFGTTAEHTAGTAGLATAVSSFDVPTGQYYIPGTTTLTLNTPAHSAGPVAVVVKNADGQSSSNTIAADNSNKYTYTSVPDSPTNLTANATPVTNQGINYNINLSWTAPVSDGYSPITDYLIEYCISNSSGVCNPSPEGDWTIYNDGTSTNTSTTISSLPASPSAYYTFRVSAINNIGTSQPSNTPTVQTSFITLSSSVDTVTININPSASGSTNTFSSTTHNLIANSNTNYNITLSMPSTTQTLSNGTHTINPTSANASNPQLDLPANTWGYRLNNTTFGTTTTIETNVPNSQYTWAQVQQSTTPDLIYTGTGNHTFPVYYGLKASHTQASGTYTGTVTYTATTQ